MHKHKGFTTIELLVVIGIIVILVGLLFVGFKHIVGSSSAQATRVTLASMKSMLTAYETQTRLGRVPPAWVWWEPASGGVVEPRLPRRAGCRSIMCAARRH